MDFKTVLVFIGIFIFITISFSIQEYLFPRPNANIVNSSYESAFDSSASSTPNAIAIENQIPSVKTQDWSFNNSANLESNLNLSDKKLLLERSTSNFVWTFNQYGGILESARYKQNKEGQIYFVDFISKALPTKGLSVSLSEEQSTINLDEAYFTVLETNDNFITFYTDLEHDQYGSWRFFKKYSIYPESQNLLSLKIWATNLNEAPYKPNWRYNLYLGPQGKDRYFNLDPIDTAPLKYGVYLNGERHERNVEGFLKTENAAGGFLTDEYFTSTLLHKISEDDVFYSAQRFNADNNDYYTLRLERLNLASEEKAHEYFLYLGPRVLSFLKNADAKVESISSNAYPLFEKMHDFNWIIGWFIFILKFFLNVFHRVFNNWGVSIIILTLFIKVLLFPISRKAFTATQAMKAMAPKQKIVMEQFKDQPERMRAEVAKLSQEYGVSFGSTFLPLILQFPIFISLFWLLRQDFDLRLAIFIPGWIEDLSRPESIFYFGDFFRLPLVGWTNLRVLPFIMLLSQLAFSFMAMDSTAQKPNYVLLYMLPIMIFVFTYDMPSGVLIYWFVSNISSLFQNMLFKHFYQKNS